MDNQVTALIRATLGEAAAEAYARIRADPELSLLFTENVRQTADLDQALQLLASVLAGEVSATEVVEPMKTLCARLELLLRLRPAGGRAAPTLTGVKIPGLVEAVAQCLVLKAKNPLLLSGFRAEPVSWGARLTRIKLLDGLNRTLADFQALVAAELVAQRTTAAQEMRSAFSEVRVLVANQLPEEDWRAVGAYLYGAAKKALQRSRQNRQAEQAVTEKAQAKVSLASRREARENAARELETLAQDLLNPRPDKES